MAKDWIPAFAGMMNLSKNKRVLITAGPTREWMDPVRFLSNPSSGSMGLAIAEALLRRGHFVTIVLGPTSLIPPERARVVRVETALQMEAAVKKHLPKSAALIASAAVGDWRFARVSRSKLKKTGSDGMTVMLVKNPDILADAGRFKQKKDLLLIGFALETDREQKNALGKLREKNLDLIIANRPDSFAGKTIRPTWIERDGMARSLPRMSKRRLSEKIAAWLDLKWKKKI